MVPGAHEHDQRGHLHSIELVAGTRIAKIIGEPLIQVNSFHREAVMQLVPSVIASARAQDGIIEAIEIPSCRFAIGIQWHQELLVGTDHPGNALFRGLVEAIG
jgi:putative glutamine amidotransferase